MKWTYLTVNSTSQNCSVKAV